MIVQVIIYLMIFRIVKIFLSENFNKLIEFLYKKHI
jgi:hypothetical protein